MAFDDIQRKRVENEKRRPPPHIRPEVDLGFRVHGESVEIFEIRPAWDAPDEKIERPFARATFVATRQVWKIEWMRADLKWHAYAPAPEVDTVDAFVAVVDKDEHACFFG